MGGADRPAGAVRGPAARWQQDRVNRFSIKASAAGVVAALLAAAEPVPSALRALPQPVQAAVQEMLQGAAGPSAAVAT